MIDDFSCIRTKDQFEQKNQEIIDLKEIIEKSEKYQTNILISKEKMEGKRCLV